MSFNGITFAYADNIQDQFILRQSIEQLVSRIAKLITDLKICHSWLAHVSYQNIVANATKVTGIEGMQGLIPTELCEICIAGHQELETFWTPILKAAKFLGKLYVDIEGSLPVTFLGFRYFLFIKNDA